MKAMTASIATLALAFSALVASSVTNPPAASAASEVTLDRTGWSVTASHSHPNTPAANMIDGSLSTGWTSGKSQQGLPEDPEYVVVDTGRVTAFDTIELAAGAAVDDYARSYEVSVSQNGTEWEHIVSGSGSLTDGIMRISLCEESSPCTQRSARYVRVTQTSGHFLNWWTIAEFDLVSHPTTPRGPATFLERDGWSMTASQGWLPASNLIDGNIGTGWTTGDGQAPGQWIQLDAGAAVTFDAVDLSAGAATSEYARRVKIEVSDDTTNWTTVAERDGELRGGASRISLCDDVATCAPATGRYVRVTQTSSHFVNSWTVAEFNLVIGDLSFLRPQATPRDTMVAPSGTMKLDVWGLAPEEPVTISSSTGSLSRTADAEGELVADVAVASAEGEFEVTVSGAWSGWSATVAVLVTTDVEGTDPDPNGAGGGAGEDGTPAAVSSLSITEDAGLIALAWEADAAAASFEIYRSTGAFSAASKIATVTAPRYNDAVGEKDRYRYYYSIVAVSDRGARAEASETVSLETELFGDNMTFFSPSDDPSQVDSTVAAAAAKMFPFAAELSDERFTFAFKPGEYETKTMNVGYYTSIYGLGETPRDTIVPRIEIPSQPADSLTNFWRSVENIGIDTGSPDTWITWATSQAAPARRLWVNGHLHLDDWGKAASGGYLADSIVTGETGSWSQQQYFLRNNDLERGWYNGGWNHVFVGNENAPTESPDWAAASWNATTVEAKTPVIREKPFLFLDDAGDYRVFVPALRDDAQGVSWSADGPGAGTSISIEDFFVAKPGDSAESINSALASGKHLLFTPGIYEVSETIEVDRANTVVLGLGMATIRPTGGVDGMHVADVDGVTVAGLLFDATEDGSQTLLRVGESGADVDHSHDPTLLADVFTRVGGAVEGKADVTVHINSSDVIGDHFWLWRADHGLTPDSTGWEKNVSANGLVVDGDRVTIYGLFVEHFQGHQTLWRGDDGSTFFYQSELPYDPPTQAAYMSHGGTVKGYASYKVTNEASGHRAVGLGVYDVFIHAGEWVVAENGIEVSPGTQLRNAAIVSFGVGGGQNHIVNGVGAGVSGGAAVKSGLNSYVEDEPQVGVVLSGTNADGQYRGTVSVALSLTQGSGVLQYRLGEEWITYAVPLEVSEAGTHRVQYRVLHQGDEYGPATGSVDFVIDTATVPTDPGTEPEPSNPPTTETPTTPRSPAETDLTADTRGVISGPAVVMAGETFEVQVGADRSGKVVSGWLFSRPVSLGRGTVALDGTVEFVVPLDTVPGKHRLAVTDTTGAVIGWYILDVRAAAALASTGGPSAAGWAALALLLILSGTSLTATRVRRNYRVTD